MGRDRRSALEYYSIIFVCSFGIFEIFIKSYLYAALEYLKYLLNHIHMQQKKNHLHLHLHLQIDGASSRSIERHFYHLRDIPINSILFT